MKNGKPDYSNVEAGALNQALIGELKARGSIRSASVEAAFQAVPRHLFLPGTPLEEVYSDRAISAKQDEKGQWISSSSQPAIMAIMLEQLALEPGHRVLEIGAGTGYNAALMAHIVGETGQIVTIDIDEDLAGAAREHLSAAGFERVQVLCADGGYGYQDGAPFDRIILTVGAPDIAPAWWDQLKPGGRMVLPLALKGSMKSIAFERDVDYLAGLSMSECGFMALRGDFAVTGMNRFQVGSDPGLYLESMDEILMAGDKLHSLLTGESKDLATGVEENVWEVMAGELWTWLSLHEPGLCKLTAEGAVAERNVVPALIGIDGIQKSASTVALVDETGLAALTHPSDLPATFLKRGKLFAPDSPLGRPFALFVRQFGENPSTGQRLVASIQEWEAAGRPSTDKMRIRAYPKDFEYLPSAGEYVIEKQWTTLVLNWPAAALPEDA